MNIEGMNIKEELARVRADRNRLERLFLAQQAENQKLQTALESAQAENRKLQAELQSLRDSHNAPPSGRRTG